MSKYSLDFDPGSDDRLPEWLVCEPIVSNASGSIQRVVFHSTCKEEAECMLQEYQYFERAEVDYSIFNDQESEFDYV